MLLVLCVAAALGIWEQRHTLYPTPETKSAFLKNYTPKSVIERFQAGEGSSHGHHSGGTAGHKFVTHTAEFESHFAMSSENWMPLMNALRDDVSAQLAHNGAQILSQRGDARAGFHFEYRLGKSFGTVTISPLSIHSRNNRATLLSQSLVDVTARIDQTETWFPKAPGTIVVRVDASQR